MSITKIPLGYTHHFHGQRWTIGQGVNVSHQSPICCWEFVTVTHWESILNNHECTDKWLLANPSKASKETELVEYLSKQEEDFRIYFWQHPERLIKKCLWQVISACIHHLTSSVRHSPLLLRVFFAFKTLTPSLPQLSVMCFRNTVWTALDFS